MALANPNITKVILGANISSGSYNINRPLEIDLNGKNIAGTLNYTHNQNGVSKLSGTGQVTNVNVDTLNASFVQAAGVTVTNLNIINVAPATYENFGSIDAVTITDADARFLNNGTASLVNIDTTGTVILGGTSAITNVIVNQAATVEVESGAQVGTLTVETSAAGTTIENGGTIAEVVANANVEITGTQPDTVTPSEGVDVVTLVGTQEELEIALNDPKVNNIKFTNDIETTSQILVKQSNQSIDGDGYKLIAKNSETGPFIYSEPNKSILTILSANGVKISNLTVDALVANVDAADHNWDGVYAVQVYTSTGVILDSLVLQNGDAGLLVNGSTVTVNGITTRDNQFGGIEVSQGIGVTSPAQLTVTGKSTHSDSEETPGIWTINKVTGETTETVNNVIDSALQYESIDDVRPDKKGYVNFFLKTE